MRRARLLGLSFLVWALPLVLAKVDPVTHSYRHSEESRIIRLRATDINTSPIDSTSNGPSFRLQSLQHPQTTDHSQWLVHVKTPVTELMKTRINSFIAPSVLGQYIPHNTFLVVGPAHDTDNGDFYARLRQAPFVLHVQEFEPSFKMDPHLWSDVSALHAHLTTSASTTVASASSSSDSKFQSLASTLAEGAAASSTVKSRLDSPRSGKDQLHFLETPEHVWLRALLAPQAAEPTRTTHTEGTVSGWQQLLQQTRRAAPALQSIDTTSSSPSTSSFYADLEMEMTVEVEDVVEVKVPVQQALQALHWLAHRREVQWVERAPAFYTQNHFASYLIQSGIPDSTVVWDHGLTGTGEVVAIADTGIDWDSCWFYDPTQTLSFDGKVNLNHRKIVSYVPLADQSDDEGGHGTHVAASLAGAVMTSNQDAYNLLSKYNGMAPGAKLAFYDLKTVGQDDLKVPGDIKRRFLGDAYSAAGARIYSNSWGSPDGSYNIFSRDIDAFFHDTYDALAVFAGGNYGDNGFYSVSSPGVAKNVLTVGASKSARESFLAAGQGGGIQIESPANLRGLFEVVPAVFGNPYNAVGPLNSVQAVVVSPLDACSTVSQDLTGKIGIVMRGTCHFTDKAMNLQRANAVLMLVVNNEYNPPSVMGSTDGTPEIHITSVMIAKDVGDKIVNAANLGTVLLSAPRAFTSPSMNESFLADFSSRGPTFDGRRKPDVLGPGQMVISARSDGHIESKNCRGGDDLVGMQGTSMSTPIVAGAVAMVRQYFRDGWYPDGVKSGNPMVPSGAMLKAMMVHSGQPLFNSLVHTGPTKWGSSNRLDRVDSIPSVFQGYGRVQLDHVLKFDNPASLALVPNLYTVGVSVSKVSETLSYCFLVKATTYQPSPFFRVTLVWMDQAPSMVTSFLLVNNLDLLVINQATGEVIVGNQQHFVDKDGDHVAWDVANNVEQISLDDKDGRFSKHPDGVMLTVVVRATSLPGGTQAFGLVATGTFDKPVSGGDCTKTVLCPNNCHGPDQGTCNVDGTCTCLADFAGSDCSMVSQPLTRDYGQTARWSADGKVGSDGWAFFYFDVDEKQLEQGLSIFTRRTSHDGDPDTYVSYNALPTLIHADYVGSDCDSCPEVQVKPIIIPREELKVGRYRIGVHGYCCFEASYNIEVGWHVEPPPQPRWFRYIYIASAVALFLTGVAVYVYVKHRARSGRQDGYVPAAGGGVEVPARMPGTGYVLGSAAPISSSSAAPATSAASASSTALPSAAAVAAAAAAFNAAHAGSGSGVASSSAGGAAVSGSSGSGMVHSSGGGSTTGWSKLPTDDISG